MRTVSVVPLVLVACSVAAQTEMLVREAPRVLTHREQADLVRSWIEKRFDVLLPELMRRLNVRFPVPEWDDQEVRLALEEGAALFEDGWRWVLDRQEALYLIY